MVEFGNNNNNNNNNYISFNIENIYSNYNSALAQVVERPTKKHEVPGSIPPSGTRTRNLMLSSRDQFFLNVFLWVALFIIIISVNEIIFACN